MTPSLQIMLQQAIQAFQAGNLDGADLILRRVLLLDSKNLLALQVLGLIKASQGNFDSAVDFLRKAMRINPNDESIQYNLAKALSDSGNAKDALICYKKIVSLVPNNPDFWLGYGKTLSSLGCYDEALVCHEKALAIDPNYAECWLSKGLSLHGMNRFEEAITCYDKALSLKSNYVECWLSSGVAFHGLNRFEEAITCYDKALSLRPEYHEVWVNRGVTLQLLKRFDEAIASYDRALSLRPDDYVTLTNKGILLNASSRLLDARTCFENALDLMPNYQKALWAKLFTSIPVVPNGLENFQELRETFAKEILQLKEQLSGEVQDGTLEVVGTFQPFYLAYQEINNKDLLNHYGYICNRLMDKWQKNNKLQLSRKKECEKIKVGIIGEQIRDHSVWNAITKGLVFNLDISKFEIHIFHLGHDADEETFAAKARATTFTNNQSSLLDWAQVILKQNVDVLLYPEIGMDALTTQLACLRLAPIQIACWGHPETTGLPTIDYYLSADLFEDELSQDAYTETLVTLPNLGCSYSRLPVILENIDIESLGIDLNKPIFICPGVPYKYSPQHDWIFVEIAKRLGKCNFIFFQYSNNLSEILRLRLAKAFAKENLNLDDYVIFIPWLKSEEFYGLMKYADAFLDTIGFSGFNTAMQAVDCALPIVTIEGKFMRGRFASGILKKMAMPDLIANTGQEYVDLAIRLAQDKEYRGHVKARIIEVRDCLYGDIEPIHAFEDFLLSQFLQSQKSI